MAIKNYVVCAHRRIASSKWVWKDTTAEGDIYQTYYEMCRHSLSSLRHFLKGSWEYVLFDEEIDNINQAMPLNNDRIYELWHSEPCNILWVGPDVQAIDDVEIFNKFKEFRLFNWTDPKSWSEPNQYNKTFENLFNNDLQYYPSTMDPELWKVEREMRAQWDTSEGMSSYNNQQIIHNTMFWSQGLDWKDAHRPDLFYQAQWLPSWKTQQEQDDWNNFKMEDAKIIHWHSSRHSPTKLACMQKFTDLLEIPLVDKLQ